MAGQSSARCPKTISGMSGLRFHSPQIELQPDRRSLRSQRKLRARSDNFLNVLLKRRRRPSIPRPDAHTAHSQRNAKMILDPIAGLLVSGGHIDEKTGGHAVWNVDAKLADTRIVGTPASASRVEVG